MDSKIVSRPLGFGKPRKKVEPKPKAEPKAPKKKGLKGMHIKKGASGGFIAKHELEEDHMGMPKMEEHSISDMDALMAHLQEHMGEDKE